MKENLCFCGHDCARCRTRLATVRKDSALREQSRLFYRETFGMDLPAEKLHCLGGRSKERFFLSLDCPFRTCCIGRGIRACRDCTDYPCGMLADYQEKYVNKCNQESEKEERDETAYDAAPDGTDRRIPDSGRLDDTELAGGRD
ncbi:MAG: DUF3795 domain-containing protein [Eubacteriales bacterium]